MIALDLDGTLINFGGGVPAVPNMALLHALRSAGVREVAIATNQGGIPFAVGQAREGKPVTYPTADEFAARLQVARWALFDAHMGLCGLRVCVYHPKASPAAVKAAAEQVRRRLPQVLPVYMAPGDWHVYTSAYTRKPRGGMLSSLAPTGTYYGDSDEDEKAAAGAGWSFVRVERCAG